MNKQTTKRSLLASVMALVLCVIMLVGTTFAWFTDTASTGVNKIQAGNLDVGLQMKQGDEWANAENETLNWVKAGNGEEEVLWEPGCTYVLPELRVVNYGNLALKYEIRITGITGDAKLLEALDFFVNDVAFSNDNGSYIGNLTAGSKANPTASEALTISGKMRTDAGNEYQGLSIDGIAVTVYATQDTVESDSFDNTYDEDAFDALAELYPVSTTVSVNQNGATEIDKGTVRMSVPADAVAENTDSITISVNKSADVDAKFGVAADGNTIQQFDVKVSGIKADNTSAIQVHMFIGKGYSFAENQVAVKHLKADGTTETLAGTYDSATGFVSFETMSFSPFAVEVPDMPMVIGTGSDTHYYDNLTDAVRNAASGDAIVFLKSAAEPLKLQNTEPMTIKDLTFKSVKSVEIKGLQLSATSKDNKVTLNGVTFDGISFTDRVVIGQSGSTAGLSQCSNITFVNCKFDMSASKEKYKDAIYHGDVSVKGTITEEAESNAYLDGLTVKNCDFKNCRNAIRGGKARNVSVEGCNFDVISSVAVNFRDVAGKIELIGNTADSTMGVLEINTVGNNYSTTKQETQVVIENNVATNMTCDNGKVYYTGFDNARASGKSTYTVSGNTCTYAKSFDEPLNGFRIGNNYGPSKSEFIANQ